MPAVKLCERKKLLIPQATTTQFYALIIALLFSGYCPAGFDGRVCWNQTAPNTTLRFPCPEYIRGTFHGIYYLLSEVFYTCGVKSYAAH